MKAYRKLSFNPAAFTNIVSLLLRAEMPVKVMKADMELAADAGKVAVHVALGASNLQCIVCCLCCLLFLLTLLIAGVDGIVVGMLSSNGSIDLSNLRPFLQFCQLKVSGL